MTDTRSEAPATDRASGPAGSFAQGIVTWARRRLGWSRLYRSLSYLRSTLWIVPILAVVVERLVFRLLHFLDRWVTWDLTGMGVAGARAMFDSVITLTLSFVVFTFGSLLVAIQVASGQMTPRIIATTLLRDKVIKYSVGLNVFTMLFAISCMNRTEETVSQLATLLAGLLGVASLAAFLFLIDYTARLLRPVRIVALVSEEGMGVVRSVYPRLGSEGEPVPTAAIGAPTRVVTHEGQSLIVLAVEIERLVARAASLGGVVEVVPQVGDFVATDEPLFKLYGGAAAIDDHELREAIAFGPERTMEQDPVFSFRILVDIALKALSPAINDPTTAVLAIDQIHRLLRLVGQRRLHNDVIHDAAGQARVILRTPNWADFVHISCCEIRACGANNLQIARRMRAMLENLILTLPESRHAALRQQLDLLDRAVREHYPFPEDLALAHIADSQGLGGAAIGGTRA